MDTKSFLDEYHEGLSAAVTAGTQSPVRKAFEIGALKTRQKTYASLEEHLEELYMRIEEGDVHCVEPYVMTVQDLIGKKPMAEILFEENRDLLSSLRVQFQSLASRIGQNFQHPTFKAYEGGSHDWRRKYKSVSEDIGILSRSAYLS